MIEKINIKLQKHQADKNRAVSLAEEKFSINFDTNDGKKVRVIKRKAAGEHINAIARDLEIKVKYGTFSLGQFAGFDLSIVHDIGGCTIQLIGNDMRCTSLG